MKRFGVVAIAALVALFLGTGLLYAQGLYLETYPSGNSGPSAKVSYMPGMAKIITQSGRIIILRIDKQYVDIISPARKTYNQISFNALKNKHFANLTRDERKMLQGAITKDVSSKNPNMDATETDESKTIEGFHCRKYVLQDGDQVVQTVWATHDVKGVDNLRRDADKLLTSLGTATDLVQPLVRWIDIVGGLPIQIDGHGTTLAMKNIKQASIPESEFQVPAGYTNGSHMHQG